MRTNRRHRITTGLSTVLIACLAATVFAGPVAAAPDPAKAAERAERKAAHHATRAERKADRAAAKAERVELREQRKAELETRKADAKALRSEAREAIAALRDGFSEMSVEERKATLDEIRGVRGGYQLLFLALMDSWREDRQELLPNTLSETPDETESDETEAEDGEVDTEAGEEPEES